MRFLVVLALILPLTATAGPSSTVCCDIEADELVTMTPDGWATYRAEVFQLLDEPETKDLALRAVIQYGDKMQAEREDVFALVRVYREDERAGYRRMAIVGLGQVADEWGMDMLARSYPVEKDKAVKKTMGAVLTAHTRRFGHKH